MAQTLRTCHILTCIRIWVMASSPTLKSIVFAELARIAQAFAHPHRLQLVELLVQAERSVEILSELIGQAIGTTSHHLKVLRNAHLVETRRDGVFIYYRATPGTTRLWRELCDAGNAGVQSIQEALRTFVETTDEFQARDLALVKRQVAAGEILLIDVRPAEEYEAGHFPGAISAPIKEIETAIRALPKGIPIVAYCRGPYCLISDTAVQKASAKGFTASRWSQGTADWLAQGVRLETGPGTRVSGAKAKGAITHGRR